MVYLKLLILGAAMVTYVHARFVSKDLFKTMYDRITIIDKRVYDLHRLNGLKDD